MVIEAIIKQLPRFLPIRRLSLALLAARNTIKPLIIDYDSMTFMCHGMSSTRKASVSDVPLVTTTQQICYYYR